MSRAGVRDSASFAPQNKQKKNNNKKTTTTREAAAGMKRQVHRIVGVVLSVYVSCFLTGRVVLLAEEYQKATLQLQEDVSHQNLCSDQVIVAQLGQRGAEGCKDSKLGAKVVPLLSALRAVAENTYLCGSTPCASLWHDMTATTTSTVALVCCVVLSPSGLYQAAKWLLDRRRRSRRCRVPLRGSSSNSHHAPYVEYEATEEEDDDDDDDGGALIVPLFSKSAKTKTA